MPREELPIAIRAVALTFNLFTDSSFDDISCLLLVHPITARKICETAKERADDPSDFRDLYATLESKKRPGRPHAIPEEKGKELGTVAMQDKQHREMKWPDDAKGIGVTAARSTVGKVMHEQHNLGRYKPITKPPLDEETRIERLNLAQWNLNISIKQWVFSDECYIEMNLSRKKIKVTRPIGSNPYDYAEHKMEKNQSPGCQLVVWSCIAYGYKGPIFIWDKETEEEKWFYTSMVEKENKEKKINKLYDGNWHGKKEQKNSVY